ncbi:CD180 antigen [Biomphalaria pfeifferi]|uniref:CD180 antigen n=1 Tax=Biomphalaria pfeifferi TaxID=112525 RepID=A0AAD8BHJ2_BIOPF|nr:CD180 antigen [Biomphalaria pfeifferi]
MTQRVRQSLLRNALLIYISVSSVTISADVCSEKLSDGAVDPCISPYQDTVHHSPKMYPKVETKMKALTLSDDSKWKFGNKGDSIETEYNCVCTPVFCDCSWLNLTTVPQNLPKSIVALNLAQNFIRDLPNCSFCNYTNLMYLDLTRNELTKFQVGSFWGLANLTILNLYNNTIFYSSKNFPAGVFEPLRSLRCLKINRNLHASYKRSFSYPDLALANLVSLESLYLDGISDLNFGKGFGKLTKLRTLVLAGHLEGFCQVGSLTNKTFRNIGQITSFNISSCNLRGENVSSDMFKPLVNLISLDVSFNLALGLNIFLAALKNVNTIEVLRMNFIDSSYLPSETITQYMVQCLPSALRTLEAQGNNFESMAQGVLQYMPPNLSYVDVGGNRFLYGAYIQELKSLRNLKVLKINAGNDLHSIPKYVPKMSVCLRPGEVRSNDADPMLEPLVIRLPPKLLCLDMRNAGLKYLLSELTFDDNNSLESLLLSQNDFPGVYGPFKGLRKVKRLTLDQCFVNEINPDFFKVMDTLEKLEIHDNQLGGFFQENPNISIFKYLKKLTYIDLSNNALPVVHTRQFEGVNNLEEINLSQNNMWTFFINISAMNKLRVLNLSRTQHASLPLETRQHIDFLLTSHEVKVDMSYTPILCECSNRDFLTWMTKSPAFDVTFANYVCRFDDSSFKEITDAFQMTMRNLNLKCADYTALFLVVVCVTLSLVIFVAGAVLYRFRWRLRYMYYAAYLMFNGKIQKDKKLQNFQFDVFMSYANEDEEFILEELLPELNRRSVKVLVHGRDFAVGEFIGTNILTAIKQSRKTLVILTRYLIRSHWCNFEIQMANVESVNRGRPVLMFLILEAIHTTKLTADLLYHLNNNTYTMYPHEETTGLFWDKLARDLLQP